MPLESLGFPGGDVRGGGSGLSLDLQVEPLMSSANPSSPTEEAEEVGKVSIDNAAVLKDLFIFV